VQGGVSPAEGKFHSRHGSNEIKASSPSGGKIKPKAKSNPTGGRAPSTKVRSKKSGGQKNKTNRSKISQPSLKTNKTPPLLSFEQRSVFK
jgi:hypothetical protein